jgi:cytidyltransferase-like protein
VRQIVVSGRFDDLRAGQVRMLQEASRLGPVGVLLWSDRMVQKLDGKSPKFPESERRYLLESIRYVERVGLCDSLDHGNALPAAAIARANNAAATMWVVGPGDATAAKEAFCQTAGVEYRVLSQEDLHGLPEDAADARDALSPDKRVIVTGCYDWFHSGHVRFFEEVSRLGDLYVVVGHDANIRLLKGEGHPMFSELERRYMVQSIRFVQQALVSSGDGWLDAEPEIQRIKPHIYAVNEDGDRPEKRAYCQAHGIEYRVLKRTPKPGLPKRQSTDLRGF